jgi:hypothetical protein
MGLAATRPPLIRKALQRRTFFFGMAVFLLLPVMPVEFTSILSAVVWIFAGTPYAIIFVVLGTFRVDSFPIYSGIVRIVAINLPPSLLSFAGSITLAIMFSGNLLTTYFFKRVLRVKFTSRFQAASPLVG